MARARTKIMSHGSTSQITMDFSVTLKERLRQEGIEVAVSVGVVDVPRGHLAIVLTLSPPDSLLELEQRVRAEHIAREECIKYLQGGGKAGK